jgi:hypothetical protein
MKKIAYVRIVWSNGHIWEYLADSVVRGKRDVNYLKGCKRGISMSIVKVATTDQTTALFRYHLFNPKITEVMPIVSCKCCGKDIRLTKELGAFCSMECVRKYNYGLVGRRAR